MKLSGAKRVLNLYDIVSILTPDIRSTVPKLRPAVVTRIFPDGLVYLLGLTSSVEYKPTIIGDNLLEVNTSGTALRSAISYVDTLRTYRSYVSLLMRKAQYYGSLCEKDRVRLVSVLTGVGRHGGRLHSRSREHYREDELK